MNNLLSGSTNFKDFIELEFYFLCQKYLPKYHKKSTRIWAVSKVGLTPLFFWPFSSAEIGYFKGGVIGVVALLIHGAGRTSVEYILYPKSVKIKVGYTPLSKWPKLLHFKGGVYPTFFLPQFGWNLSQKILAISPTKFVLVSQWKYPFYSLRPGGSYPLFQSRVK